MGRNFQVDRQTDNETRNYNEQLQSFSWINFQELNCTSLLIYTQRDLKI